MKITSKFTDYYDHAVAPSMIDPQIRYVRMASAEDYHAVANRPLAPWEQPFVHKYHKHQALGKMDSSLYLTLEIEGRLDSGNYQHKEDLHFAQAILLVAGKAYPTWIRERVGETYSNEHYSQIGYPDFPQVSNDQGFPRKDSLPYGAPELDDFKAMVLRHFESHPRVVKVEHYRPLTTPFNLFNNEERQEQYDQQMELFCTQDYNGMMFNLQVPVALIVPPRSYTPKDGRPNEKTLLIKNPPLRAFQFFKLMDQYTCWQEISMWIGGVMPGRCSPMVEIGDDSKIKKHGFDPVYGFRKRKQGTT